MSIQPAGTKLEYTVTYLEMTHHPRYPWPVMPVGFPGNLVRAERPPDWYFLSLYDAVGRDYAWEDMHSEPPGAVADWLADPKTSLWTLLAHGWPQGFFVIDAREAGRSDLSYFGLVPEAVGKGVGRFLLQTAILTGWSEEGTEKVTVNTCTLDHPRALGLYQWAGFDPVRRETLTRVLTRPRDLSRIPD
ncbi:MAG: GNAT family N-acetyltransferase [Pseudomonadota bacterium]